jgi:hypothetical protein
MLALPCSVRILEAHNPIQGNLTIINLKLYRKNKTFVMSVNSVKNLVPEAQVTWQLVQLQDT